MRHEHTIPFLLVLTFGLTGCSDYQLSKIEPVIETPAGNFVEPVPVGTTPITPPRSSDSSPWGSLNPGEMPEEYFAVAWHDPREVENNCYGPCPGVPRYDIIDITGQVVSSFESPSQLQFSAQHKSLQPAGPGRFLAVTTGSTPDSDYHEHAWIGDGVSGEQEIIMQWGWGSTLFLPLAEKEIELPGLFYSARVMVDPHDEDRFYLLTDNTMMYAQPLLGTLYSINVRDATAEVFAWEAPDMVSADLIPEWGHAPWDPWLVDTFQKGDETMLTLGLHLPDEEGNWRTLLAAFSPQSGPMDWSIELTGLHMGGDLVVVPPNEDNEGRVLFHQDSDQWCPNPGFISWDGEHMTSFSGNDSLYCSRLGPVLDDGAETFIYYGYSEATELEQEQRAFISHRGMDVWEYSHFRDGLALRPFEIHGMARLERPQP